MLTFSSIAYVARGILDPAPESCRITQHILSPVLGLFITRTISNSYNDHQLLSPMTQLLISIEVSRVIFAITIILNDILSYSIHMVDVMATG